jgi:hypothetical protein
LVQAFFKVLNSVSDAVDLESEHKPAANLDIDAPAIQPHPRHQPKRAPHQVKPQNTRSGTEIATAKPNN